MKKTNRLLFWRNIFTFIVVISFTIIIVNEKANTIFLPKIEKKINNYLTENYSEIKEEITTDKIFYNKKTYTMRVSNKNNKNLYFNIYYKNKKISDTYKKDYLQGKSLYTSIEKKLEKEINKKTGKEYSITIITNLNKFTPQVQKRIINENNLLQLKFFNIEKEIIIKDWNKENITKEINDVINNLKENGITPKYYTITITDANDITKSIKIDKITEDFTTNKNKNEIISAIINNEHSELLNESKIEYTFLN